MEVASYNEGVQRYGYDPLYRLTSWTSPSRQTVRYAYDAVGNRLSVVAPTGTVNSTYDVADELLTAGGAAFTYDGNGNQVSKTTAGTTLTYGWDGLNRLLSVMGGGVNTQYQYDGDGNRVSQQTSAGTYAYVNDTATTLPVVVNENGPDGNISYAYGSSLISASATGLQSFYQFDGLGSVATVTDGAASQKAGYAYDPWGSVIGGGDLLGTKNKFKFTGEAVDPGTGLVFLRTRYYDPATGKFLSRDSLQSIGEAAYMYAHGAPTQFRDPSGLMGFWSNLWDATKESVESVPSFALCSVTGFEAGEACRNVGFSQEFIDAGKAVTPIGFITGPIAVSIDVIPKMVHGTLSNAEAAKAVWDLATSFPFVGILKNLPVAQYVAEYLLTPVYESPGGDVLQPRGPHK
jgi:RHS repeat-associated protein